MRYHRVCFCMVLIVLLSKYCFWSPYHIVRRSADRACHQSEHGPVQGLCGEDEPERVWLYGHGAILYRCETLGLSRPRESTYRDTETERYSTDVKHSDCRVHVSSLTETERYSTDVKHSDCRVHVSPLTETERYSTDVKHSDCRVHVSPHTEIQRRSGTPPM